MARSVLHRSKSMAMVRSWSSEKCSSSLFPVPRWEMPKAKGTGNAVEKLAKGLGSPPHAGSRRKCH